MDKILGQALKKEREMRGLTIADIANETRIGSRYLLALENEEFDMFAGIFYIRYNIKNYLRACGADEKAFFNTYQDYLKSVLDKKTEPRPEHYLQKIDYIKFKKRKTIVFVILLLALLAALAYWLFGNSLPASARKAAFDFPASSPLSWAGEDELCYDAAPVAMHMRFTDSCWLQLWRGGEKILEKTFAKDDTLDAHGYALTVFIGNPAAIQVTVNDQEITPFQPSSTGLRLVLNPEKLAEILPK